MRLIPLAALGSFASVMLIVGVAHADWQEDLKELMRTEHGCDVDRITFVSFTNTDGEEQIFATVDCKNTRSYSVQRVGDEPFNVSN